MKPPVLGGQAALAHVPNFLNTGAVIYVLRDGVVSRPSRPTHQGVILAPARDEQLVYLLLRYFGL